MPTVSVDVHEHLRECRAEMSEAVHRGLMDGWGMPADDLVRIFTVHPEGDPFSSRTHPDADRTDIASGLVLAFTGCSPEVQQRGAALVVERPSALGIRRDDVLVAVSEHGDGDWSAPGTGA